jgi:hypothetical protein
MKGEMRMDIGVTDQLSWCELAGLYQKKGLSDAVKGMSFAKLAAARISEVSAEQPAGPGALKEGTGGGAAGSYMGESYEERLSKITDKNAANAFRKAYALKMEGGTDYISVLSRAYASGITGAANFADAFSQYSVITHVGNADISPSNWQRNDFPFWKYFRPDTSADALNDWRPTGPNPPQTRGDLQRNYGSIGPGRIAVLVPESLQQKMDADPAYARQIMAKLQEWKADYDRWDNTVAASYGMDVAEHQVSKSYVFDLDENGDVRNCTVTSSGGRLTGPTKEEQELFEAEQDRKYQLRVKYIRIMEEGADRRRLQEYENMHYLQSRLAGKDWFL